MAIFSGQVQSYYLSIWSKAATTGYEGSIILKGTFGTANYNFVPLNGTLGANQKRPMENVFDVWSSMSTCPRLASKAHTIRNSARGVSRIRYLRPEGKERRLT